MITLIAESSYSSKAIAIYKKLGPIYHWFELKENEKSKIKKITEILVVRLALTVDKKLINSMPKLKIIATSTTGLNHIDTDYAAKKGIKIISLRGETSFLKNIPSTAEETMGLIIALMRRLLWAFEDVKAGRWRTNEWVGHQLKDKTLGLLGFGRLGKLVAGYARAFRMKVIASDPYASSAVMKKLGAQKVTETELFKKADIVSLHVLLTDKTKNMIGEKHLQLMKPTAYLINTARGELIAEGALEKALKEKWIAGAAVDVMRNEREDGIHLKNNALLKYAKQNKNLIIVPHIGGTTREAMDITQEFLADKVARLAKIKK